jgi:predicted TIM-barrel fold metal-dependent hydrolase
MRLSRGSVGALSAGLLIAFAMWPATQAVRGLGQVVAQEKPKAKTPLVGAAGSRHAGNKPKASSKDGQPLPPPIVLESAPIDHPLSSEVLYRSKNESRIAAALKAQVDFDIKPQSFKDALDLIASHYQISIVIDQRSFDDANIDVTDEVALNASSLTLHDTLHWLFSQILTPIEYEFKNGALWVSTFDKLSEDQAIVVYDCRDLIPVHPPRQGPNQRMSISVRTRAAQLIATLKATTTRPDDWEDCCSGETIVYLEGLIVARQNPFVHEKIRHLLADLRWMRTHGAFAASADSHSDATKTAPWKKASAVDDHTTAASVVVEREPVDHPLRSDVAERPKNEARIIEALKAPVDFQIQPQSLRDAVEFIATRYQIPIVIDRRALGDANANLATKVRVNIPGITLHELLHWLFEQSNCPVEYEVRNGALLISTLDKLNEDLSIVIYDCRDLLTAAGPDSGSPADQRGFGGGFLQTSPDKAEPAVAAPQTEAANTSPAARPQPAITAHASVRGIEGAWGLPFIRTIVETGPEVSWGEDASISEFGGLVVIRQCPREHERIKRLLASIRLMKKNGAFAGLADQFVDPKPAAPAHSK